VVSGTTRAKGILNALRNPLPGARRRISVAILALGGQGGGVLAQWITHLAEHNGYRAQMTSVPGVAQRTGATIYYVEMGPWNPSDPEPILSLTPVPDDVDIVIASELMEGGRAILRNFVSRNLTTLIASSHRVYAISEKSARADGIARSKTILDTAMKRAMRFICFDMDAMAQHAGSMISAVMFGALAGSEALPFPRDAFVEVINVGGKAIAANLAGFEAGFESSRTHHNLNTGDVGPSDTRLTDPRPSESQLTSCAPSTAAGRALHQRIVEGLPAASHQMAIPGVQRLMDYQDAAYANFYLDRLTSLRALDDGRNDWLFTREAARYLALWMSYDDVIRVADLKIRAERVKRVRSEVRAKTEEIVSVTEFLHPRFQEVCDTLPPSIGAWLLRNRWANRLLGRFFTTGRFVETTGFIGFATLAFVASLRRWRRSTLRYLQEQSRVDAWLKLAQLAAASDLDAAVEIIRCQRLIKGYGETYERGLADFDRVVTAYREIAGTPNAARLLRTVRDAALTSAER
jgi:indolepyruvate ferredoxin oxidoreductase beta subunit